MPSDCFTACFWAFHGPPGPDQTTQTIVWLAQTCFRPARPPPHFVPFPLGPEPDDRLLCSSGSGPYLIQLKTWPSGETRNQTIALARRSHFAPRFGWLFRPYARARGARVTPGAAAFVLRPAVRRGRNARIQRRANIRELRHVFNSGVVTDLCAPAGVTRALCRNRGYAVRMRGRQSRCRRRARRTLPEVRRVDTRRRAARAVQ